MNRNAFVISRRLVLKGIAATAAASAASPVFAQGDAEAVLFTISDLHAPYARLPALLDRFRSLRDEAGVPAAVLINGDVFERGNVVCQRSGGAADWAFLSALAAQMPVIVNLGNHETAILDDMTSFTARADQAGLRVISNLFDRRTGRFFAPVSDRIGLGGIDIAFLGLAATNPFVYRQPVRDTLTFLNTAQFVADALPDTGADADLRLIMSHAGVTPDKAYIDTLPEGTVVQGGHDHLTFDLEHKGIPYFHGGSWGTKIGVLRLSKGSDGVNTRYSTVEVAPGDGNAALNQVIEDQKAQHLTDSDKEVIAEIPEALDMHSSILLATEAMRKASDADVAMIGHTTFGAPLAAGPLTRYDFDAFVRFGGDLKLAELTGDQLLAILPRTNQFMAETLQGRTGDYVHVEEIDVDPAKTYRLAVNGWTARNQQSYLGTEDLAFSDVEGLELKDVVADHLRDMF
ncbi:MAG: 5'-nucleotidase C-terminal domain-containing protein [Pseudomonadota bacterium]